jgi:putative ATP-dependent endonuclease of OLD family
VVVRIHRVKIVNHSRIADLALGIRGHAVIVGANDVGKSSLLRLLNLLLGSSTGALYQQLTLADLRDPAGELIVEVVFIDFDDTDRALFPSEIDVAESNKAESLRVRMTVSANPDDAEAVEIRRWFPDAGHERAPNRDQLLRFGWRYLPATRGASASSVDGPNSALQTLLGAIELGDERDELSALLGGFNNKLAASIEIGNLRANAARHLSRAMPRSVEKDDLAVRTAADPENEVLGGVSMFFKRGDDHVPITEQSDGLRQLVSMTLFDLAEGTANVVAIDEPELHLHPSSQRTVAELFGTASNQKLLVTHSPFIVQRFEPADVIAVNREGVCHQIPDHKLNAVEKERINWWSPRLLEVLTARYAIIVEGLTDRIIVERCAELAGIALDRIGAVVFDIDGANKFPHVYRIIGVGGFNVPLLGLVDENEKGVWLGAIGGKPKNVLGTTLWVSEPDLEAECCAAFGGPAAAQALIDGGYCKEQDILRSAGVSDITQVTDNAAANYCRSGKVAAAIALASQLDATTATKISSVNGLLQGLNAKAVSP